MSRVILTLQLPYGVHGIPVATTANPEGLRYLKETVLREREVKTEVSDETWARLAHLEFERLGKAMDTLIPDTQEGYDAR